VDFAKIIYRLCVMFSAPSSLGDSSSNGYAYYELEVTGPVQAVPEPGTLLLSLLGVFGFAGAGKRYWW
jgi:hypothetical protein